MEKLIPDNLTFSEVGHLPIIKEFAKKIKLVETPWAKGQIFNLDK